MRCPFCRGDETRVVDSRDADGGTAVRRRRQCTACEQRFTTFERVEEAPLVIVKRDGSREPFDRAKVISGVSKACKNRPVSDEAMRALTDEVEESLRESSGDVPSPDVGLEVLSRLRDLDEVAYVRFASVYEGFEDVAEFTKVIRELQKTSPPKSRSGRGRVTGGR